MKSLKSFILLNLIAIAPTAWGECVALVKGAVAVDVATCGVLNPEATFDLKKDDYRFIADLPAAERKKFYDSYRGLILKGKVVKSMAKKSGLSPEKGVLAGEEVQLFVPPGVSCAGLPGGRVAGNIEEVCCEGGGDVPCLLNSPYVIRELKKIGEAGSRAGDKERKTAIRSADYKAGLLAYTKKDLVNTVKNLEKARAANSLDVKGNYILAETYRRQDDCRKAVPILEGLNKKYQAQDFWDDERSTMEEANFLLARCYAKLNKPGDTISILMTFLLDPKKDRKWIESSLKHKDFGWIHTSKEYRTYKDEATRALHGK
ncbi:MAG: tetratricopeptide repeat protein [Oligoflexales bacterium]